ncbi:MAG: hypothetical protein SAK29_21005 [Scytonema sp. PMC 1069.18]|nr:hypothetical protein [Scytonema sp. PMC 1069.18]MEC4885984.1 hypothetical protein [Scytonema sp. PMC 1070.18]
MNADVGVSLAAGYADEFVFYPNENCYNITKKREQGTGEFLTGRNDLFSVPYSL